LVIDRVGLKPITLAKLRHSNISRMRAAGVPAHVVAAWHGHTERMTQAVYGRVTDDRIAAAAVFRATAYPTSTTPPRMIRPTTISHPGRPGSKPRTMAMIPTIGTTPNRM
jgi:hypothetical protein